MESYPYGYRYALAPFEEEQRIITYIGELYLKEKLSQREIVRRLNKEGVTCRGRPWHQGTISRIVSREFGDQTHRRKGKPRPSWRDRARDAG